MNEDFKEEREGKEKRVPLPWLGEGSLWAAGLSASSADSEARPGGEAYRPEHAEPHPQERSQDPAWLGDGETQAKAEGSESDQVDVDLPRPNCCSHIHMQGGTSAAESMRYQAHKGA